MEDIKQVLALFDSRDKWNAFIELSNMREEMVSELKTRLQIELQKIAESELVESGWSFGADKNCVYIQPNGKPLIAINIEWKWWNAPNAPWCKRSACLWVDANSIDSAKVFDQIKSLKGLSALRDYVENIQNHTWLPFAKQIPAKVFDVNESTTSVEECLYLAKDNAKLLAKSLWSEVFKPFAYKECADLMVSIANKASK
jgi:hypothetical protein